MRKRSLEVGAAVALLLLGGACASLEGISDITGVDAGRDLGEGGSAGSDAAGSSSGGSSSGAASSGAASSGGGDGSAADGAGACAESTTQCDPNGGGVQTCTSMAWSTPVPCQQGICVNGACSGSCSPGSTQCSGTSLQKCDSTTGMWGTPAACATHRSCTGGGDAGIAKCTCDTDVCDTATASAAVCEDTATLATCAQDGQGCWYGSSPTSCTNGACFGSPGSAQCCTNACTLSAKQCTGNPPKLETCVIPAGSNGCTIWGTPASCGTNQTCSGAGVCACSAGFTSCPSGCTDTTSDRSNCGSCSRACPVLAAPNSGATCASSACSGNLGNAVAKAGGTNIGLDTSDSTVYFVKVTTSSAAGTYRTVCASVGSNDASGTATQVILGLYSDSGGQPGAPLLYTDYSDSAMSFSNPDPPHILCADGFITPSGSGGFAGITPSTNYWVYIKVGSSVPLAGPSTGASSCVSASWINVDPPCCPTTFGSCPGNIQAYLVESFP